MAAGRREWNQYGTSGICKYKTINGFNVLLFQGEIQTVIRILFWISLSFIFYTYLLYPLLIVLTGRLMKRKPALGGPLPATPSITVIIIAHNEESGILQKLENCRQLEYPPDLLTVCVVSDGSTDRTAEILDSQDDILFIRDDDNRGKPHQINKAVQQSQSDLIVFSDSRQMYRPDALEKLARNFADPAIGAVSGELIFISAQDHTERSVGLYWRYEKILRKAESDVDSTLGVTGAIYAMRRDLFETIPDDTILDDIEIPLRAFKKGYRVTFDGEAVATDTASTEIEAEFRRKVRTLAGNFQLFGRNLWLLNPFMNRIFFQAVSHKLFRLLVPYFLIIMLITSYLAGGPVFSVFFWIQVVCYLLGVAALGNQQLRKNRIINFISVFISLNAASVFALYGYLSGQAGVRWKK